MKSTPEKPIVKKAAKPRKRELWWSGNQYVRKTMVSLTNGDYKFLDVKGTPTFKDGAYTFNLVPEDKVGLGEKQMVPTISFPPGSILFYEQEFAYEPYFLL